MAAVLPFAQVSCYSQLQDLNFISAALPLSFRQQQRLRLSNAARVWRLCVTADAAEAETEAVTAENEATADVEATEEADVPAQPSPADVLMMLLQAEGTLPESSSSSLQETLEGLDAVSSVKINSFEGMTTISLTKKTYVQATNVASELVDTMEKGGFKIHTLHLSIDDGEE